MLRDADTAMYRAKTRGTGGYDLFDHEMQAEALERLQLETDLRRGLERQEFRIRYQPIVELATGGITGFEALLRWQHPDRGLLYPAAFLGVAEETGLIIPIGGWVLRQCCTQARAWQQRFGEGRPLSMSMNVTSQSFAQSDVQRTVEDALSQTGLEGRHLRLEITERPTTASSCAPSSSWPTAWAGGSSRKAWRPPGSWRACAGSAASTRRGSTSRAGCRARTPSPSWNRGRAGSRATGWPARSPLTAIIGVVAPTPRRVVIYGKDT